MALIPSFSCTQGIGDPSTLTFTDTSTGTDATIVTRNIYLKKADGTYLVPSGTSTNNIVWSYANASISFSVLDRDYAFTVEVDWLNSVSTVVYTTTQILLFKNYGETFLYNLSTRQASNPSLLNNHNYLRNKSAVRVLLDDANSAITLASDIATAQLCLGQAKSITDALISFC